MPPFMLASGIGGLGDAAAGVASALNPPPPPDYSTKASNKYASQNNTTGITGGLNQNFGSGSLTPTTTQTPSSTSSATQKASAEGGQGNAFGGEPQRRLACWSRVTQLTSSLPLQLLRRFSFLRGSEIMQHKPQFNSILGINKDGKASGKHSFFPQRKPAVPTAPIAPGTIPCPCRNALADLLSVSEIQSLTAQCRLCGGRLSYGRRIRPQQFA